MNCVPLHCAGIPLRLHACGRKRARAWLILGSGNIGTLADITRQAHSILVLIKDTNESQHVLDGAVKPIMLLVLPVMRLAHGVKLLIIEVVHGVLICPVTNFTEVIKRVIDITAIWKSLSCPMEEKDDVSVSGRWWIWLRTRTSFICCNVEDGGVYS